VNICVAFNLIPVNFIIKEVYWKKERDIKSNKRKEVHNDIKEINETQ
jgi:hypothetical protein